MFIFQWRKNIRVEIKECLKLGYIKNTHVMCDVTEAKSK